MAFNNISDSRMYDEIMEVVDNLRLFDKDIDFLESVEGRAQDDALSGPQRGWLDDIYRKACALSEGHHE